MSMQADTHRNLLWEHAGAAARVFSLSCLLMVFILPLAHADDDDVITYRQLIMKQLDAESGALGMIVSGQIPPDALASQTRAIADSARAVGKAFEPKVQGGKAKPEVWAKWADFSKRIELFTKKSEEMAKVGETGNVAKVTELMVDALTCKQCHDVYRNKK
jgi:cytochrome c556